MGCFDKMSSFYRQLDLFKHAGSTVDRKTLLTLNGGGAWSRNFQSFSPLIAKTAFVTGFIQPMFVFQMQHSLDQDGFNDRQPSEFEVPLPKGIPHIKDILQQVYEQHHNISRVYSFKGEAYESFGVARYACSTENVGC